MVLAGVALLFAGALVHSSRGSSATLTTDAQFSAPGTLSRAPARTREADACTFDRLKRGSRAVHGHQSDPGRFRSSGAAHPNRDLAWCTRRGRLDGGRRGDLPRSSARVRRSTIEPARSNRSLFDECDRRSLA